MEVLSIAANQPHDIESDYRYAVSEDYLEDYELPDEPALVEALSKRLEEELRQAKNTHLMVGEVHLPTGLTHRIAQDVFRMADKEPCGLRGCTMYISFEGQDGCNRKLSSFSCDPNTPATFEVYLTLKQSSASWNNFLPQLLKKITSGGGVMISSQYQLLLKKLYRPSLY